MNKRVKIDSDKKAVSHRSGKVWIGVIVVFALLGIITVGGIYAKYIKESQSAGQISSPNFYFTSDILGETPKEYLLNPGADGTTEITFSVRNFADELRIADKDIDFTVTVSPSDGVSIRIDSVETSIGTLMADPSAGSSATVTVSGLKNGESYTIVAVGESGFVSTLRATVTVDTDGSGVYKNTNTSADEYVLLTVWTENVSGEVGISVPAGLIPDSTDSQMREVYNYSDGKYVSCLFTDSIEVYSSHVYRFFKTADYGGEGFTVTLGGKTATETVLK